MPNEPRIGAAAFAAAYGQGAINCENPRAAADELVLAHYINEDGARRLHFWRGEFFHWNSSDSHYASLPPNDIREKLYELGHAAGKPPRKRNIDDVFDALKARCNLSDTLEPPCWLPQAKPGDPKPREIIPMANGLLDVGTRSLIPPTPRFFCSHSLPIAFDPGAMEATRWLAFLHDLWGDDDQSIGLLRQWFGYCLLPDTTQQKILALIGPIRSGKGTIIRILLAMLGRWSSASPTLSSLAQPFGLASLIGKLLCVITDARLSGRVDGATVVENLLRISGEDAITVPRKYLADWSGTLPTRLMMVSNEIPRFSDSSGAIASRFLILETKRSFFDREDIHLTDALLAELPAIFLWALQGLDELRENGRFMQPASGAEIREQMTLLASPVKTFVDDSCELDATAETAVGDLYAAWRTWAERNGYKHAGSQQTFGRDLRAAFPALRVIQHRVNSTPARFYAGLLLKGEAR